MNIFPTSADQSPGLLLNLLSKLKVRDVMTRDLVTVARRDTMRRARQLMKSRAITGLPVVENHRLFGIVSMDDIVDAIETGGLEDPVESHMATRVVVLEEEMPLSLGASYFEQYAFGRFPVLDTHRRTTGILTSRDVSNALLREVFREFDQLEARAQTPPSAFADLVQMQFGVKRHDFDRAGKVSYELKRVLKARALDATAIRRIATASYEMEMNLIVHSLGGAMDCWVADKWVEVSARDTGPGIANVEQALVEGFSTATEWIKSLGFGAGMGLSNIRRVSDEFDLQSQPGAGTFVRSRIYLSPQAKETAHDAPRPGATEGIDAAAAGVP
jgi:CBS domain-containing protein/anti-sigma regulatory factor (Ser/Thr protein kinase)